MMVRPDDTAGRWHIRLADGTTEVSRGDAPADCVLAGPAAGLYALLWSRADATRAAVTITGDPRILVDWSSSIRVAW